MSIPSWHSTAVFHRLLQNSGRVPRRASRVSGLNDGAKLWISYDPIVTKSKEMQKKTLQNFTQYDPIVTQSKGMLKTLEFHAIFDPTVTELKGMLKTPEFRTTYDPIVTESKGTLTNSRISCNT